MFPPPYRPFEDWSDWANQIDTEDLVRFINRELRQREIYLSDTDINQALSELQNAARSENYGLTGSREDRLMSMIKKRLTRDLDSTVSQGLYRSRSCFLTCCFVARRVSSNELAKALLRFFSKEGTNIVEEERSFLLTEWCLGLQQLTGLVPEDKLGKAFHQVARLGPPMFEEWRRPGLHHSWVANLLKFFNETTLHDHSRGRGLLQLSGQRDMLVRRLSAPAFRSPSIIDIPPYPRTGYSSPMRSPRHEMNALHLQQQAHEFEIDRLRRDVDSMRHRY